MAIPITAWQSTAVRHIPASPEKNYDVLDFSYCGQSNENRWNFQGEPTLYLAKSNKVALAEYARHFEENRSPKLARLVYRRKVYRFDVNLDAAIDLTHEPTWRHFPQLENPPACFQKKRIARAIAHYLRNTTRAQGLVVPSVAFMDDIDEWCLVLFLEKLPSEPKKFLKNQTEAGYFEIGVTDLRSPAG